MLAIDRRNLRRRRNFDRRKAARYARQRRPANSDPARISRRILTRLADFPAASAAPRRAAPRRAAPGKGLAGKAREVMAKYNGVAPAR